MTDDWPPILLAAPFVLGGAAMDSAPLLWVGLGLTFVAGMAWLLLRLSPEELRDEDFDG